MIPAVELINNPYTQRLTILIDGKAVSMYSGLEKYITEPFVYWCDRILHDIFEECNQNSFRLHFSSRQEEITVMEQIAASYPACIQFSSSPPMHASPLAERMRNLSRLIKEKRIQNYPRFRCKAWFVISENMADLEKELKEIEINNTFCSVEPQVIYYKDFSCTQTYEDVVVLLGDQSCNLDQQLVTLGIENGFGIIIGNRQRFLKKYKNVFLYETTWYEVFNTIFDCMLLFPLSDIFHCCLQAIESEYGETYAEELYDLQNISIKIIPQPDSVDLEVGKSSRLQFVTEIPGYKVDISKLHFSYNPPNIIKCNGMFVEGLKSGKATLNIFKEGETSSFASLEYTVIQRNRITDLKLDEDVVYIGEGSTHKVEYSFLPADADNESMIIWESTNPQIAMISKNGIIKGVKKGQCTIHCYAEQVSASCRCVVKPHLRYIIPSFAEINMVYGDKVAFEVQLEPDNCIDDNLMITSLNMQIANVAERTIKAVGLGDTKIVIQNLQETVKAEIWVHVMSEKEYRKKEKEKLKKQKNGWLSRLLG